MFSKEKNVIEWLKSPFQAKGLRFNPFSKFCFFFQDDMYGKKKKRLDKLVAFEKQLLQQEEA